MNPHSAAHHSIFAFKPSAELALADTGIDPYAGGAVWLEAHNQNEAYIRLLAMQPGRQRRYYYRKTVGKTQFGFSLDKEQPEKQKG